MDRKTVEKNRRIHMKSLFFKLSSLIPSSSSPPPDRHSHPSKVSLLSQEDQIDQAAAYITELSQRVTELKQTKERMALAGAGDRECDKSIVEEDANSPEIQLKKSDSTLEVIIVSGTVKKFRLDQVIDILEDEGVEVVNINISNKGLNVVHIIHTKIRICRIGVDTSRIYERLQQLITL